MNPLKTLVAVTATSALVLTGAACSNGPTDRLVCVDRVSQVAFDEDDQCEPDDDDYTGLGVWMLMSQAQYNGWKNTSTKYTAPLSGLRLAGVGADLQTVYSKTKKKVKAKPKPSSSKPNTSKPSSSKPNTSKPKPSKAKALKPRSKR